MPSLVDNTCDGHVGMLIQMHSLNHKVDKLGLEKRTIGERRLN